MTTTHNEEKEKYEKAWNTEGYRIHSPGEQSLEAFVEIVNPKEESSVIDFGSGTARASMELAKRGHYVQMLDITEQSMDPEVRKYMETDYTHLKFNEVNLWDMHAMFVYSGDYGYCCDVMEHIPTEYVMQVLNNIMACTPRAFFYICLLPDSFGQIVGKPLHLTVKPFMWWLEKLNEVGTVVDARDLIANGLYYVEAKELPL